MRVLPLTNYHLKSNNNTNIERQGYQQKPQMTHANPSFKGNEAAVAAVTAGFISLIFASSAAMFAAPFMYISGKKCKNLLRPLSIRA